MPNAPKTPIQRFRLDTEPWQRFGELTKAEGTDRSSVIRQFVLWYIGTPKVAAVRRPKAEPAES
ncbi:hypothetical protein PV733_36745 [Streptomyces europaeiscabiei]|uniref:hypothetical protein n=1 Tax=Streptomyces europaeiscabiei TaxID=146819 RepID=UPI0029A8A39A|nr:hypothetical protein [Streptomyces europaeiscabiei]MDX3714380.1 hypothetical protein [Streptomyces europaeiscabiei]